MAITAPAHNQASSKPMIEGVPHALHRVKSSFTDMANTLQGVVTAAVTTCQEELRSALQHDDQWSAWVDNVSLTWDGSGFAFSFIGTDEEVYAMRSLEYGDGEGTPPRPLLRNTSAALTYRLAEEVNAGLTKELGLDR